MAVDLDRQIMEKGFSDFVPLPHLLIVIHNRSRERDMMSVSIRSTDICADASMPFSCRLALPPPQAGTSGPMPNEAHARSRTLDSSTVSDQTGLLRFRSAFHDSNSKRRPGPQGQSALPTSTRSAARDSMQEHLQIVALNVSIP